MLLSMYQCTLYLLLICICVNVSLQQDEAGAGQCVEQEDGSCVATSSPPEHAKKTTKTYPPFTLQTSLRSICTLIGPCGEVNRFDSTDHALNRYLRDRQPVLLGGGDSVASKWKALKWNLWYWASKTWTNLVDVIELHQEKDHTDGVILIRDQTEAAETSYSSFQALEVKEDILLWDYLNDIPQHNHSEHYLCRFYSTDYLEMENMAKLQADSTWRDLRITEDIGLSDKDTKDLVESIPPLFNFLYPGCTLQGRYQDYHMVRVQILGSAKYYLVPPKKISEYLPFPFTHSASRQSQVNLRAILALGNIEDEEEDYEMSERTMFLQQVKNSLQEKRLTSKGHMMQSVVVNAGETLFIPPGYMVYSEAIFPSVFLDVLSPSKEQILLMEAMMTPVPMQKATVDKKEDPNKSLTADEQIIFTQVC